MPAPSPALVPGQRSELVLRIASSVVLAPAALLVAWIGGWLFAAFWVLAAVGLLAEWIALAVPARRWPIAAVGALALAAAAAFLVLGGPAIAAGCLGAALVVAMALAQWRGGLPAAGWAGAGVVYATVALVAPLLLRLDATWGWPALVLLFAVVWTTDVAAYFAGRSLGGPRLWPRVSPNKTWSGAIAGVIGAGLVAVAVGLAFGVSSPGPLAGVGVLLSVVSQGGDLLESGIKRRFGAKDAGHIIPGHGGLMDRLDGFVMAALLALLIGLFHSGGSQPATGLLQW